MNHIIEAHGLTKVFPGGIVAVNDVSFSVEEGEIFGFLGPNGAGKSTTIAMLTTLIRPTKGHATVAGIDILKQPYQARLAIGYVSQDLAVEDALTGYENLRLQAGFYHIVKIEALKRIDEVLEMVDLKDRAKDKVETYSGGMRKRLDIACGLIHRPRVLFLDEPTLGLDIQTRREIWKYVNHLRKEIRMTIFVTTHYMDEADSLCDRIAIIDKGIINILDTPAALKTSLGNEIVDFTFSKGTLEEQEETLQKITSLDFIRNIKFAQEKGYIASVTNGESSVPAIFEAIRDFPAKIGSISFKQPSLDDVFLHYTGHEMREEKVDKETGFRTRMIMRRTRR
ncbi:MAG: ATP-binding cassette domain-containing protein [Bacteroidetes bacterium]|nr:ATP-binding cassette domain-containing protein [Bacteroidota bacterium]